MRLLDMNLTILCYGWNTCSADPFNIYPVMTQIMQAATPFSTKSDYINMTPVVLFTSMDYLNPGMDK